MAGWKNFFGGLRGLFRKEDTEHELDEELRDYLDKSTAEKMRLGMTRADAYRAARMEMGGAEVVKEKVRDASWETVVETIWADLRFGARLLRFNPVFAAAAILSLALGIGANTAIFQLLDAVRMRTLPVKNPQELAHISIKKRQGLSGDFNGRFSELTNTLWEGMRDQQAGFSSVFAWGTNTFNLSPAGEVHNVQGLWVSGEYFETLGVEPAAGRLIHKADDRAGCAAGAVISYPFWQHEYGGDPAVIGKSISINRQPFPIIGVTQEGFFGVEIGRYFDVALPLCAEPVVDGAEYAMLPRRAAWWLAAMGRLKPGWTLERASAQLRTISPGIFEAALPTAYNEDNKKSFVTNVLSASPAGSGVSDLRQEYENPLWLLLGLAGVVLVIASANLANLLLARGSAREKELALRMAVGAGRGRLIRQLLAESLLLAVIGGALGAWLARGLSYALVASLTTRQEPLFVEMATDWRMLGFTSGLALLTCLLFGLAPALQATRVSPGLVLKEGTRGSSSGRGSAGLRRALVVAQVALSLALLVGGLLFGRSLSNIAKVDAGFRRDGILVTDVDYSMLSLANQQRVVFGNELLRRVRAIAGVDAAGIVEYAPLSGNASYHDVLFGTATKPVDENQSTAFNIVGPGFFETMGTPVLLGRDFDEHDAAGAPLVAIVNETFARKIAKTANPVGMTFRVHRMGSVLGPFQIVGLVKDTKYLDLREQPTDIAYTAMAQNDHPDTDTQMVIRARLPLAELIAGVKDAAKQANPNLYVSFYPLRERVDDGLLLDRLMARLSGFFGGLAVLLAVIGLYGVISYMVSQRRNEIGIRMSLGASRGAILALVLRESLVLLGAGLATGIVLALTTSRAAASMLFGLKPYDAVTLIVATVSLTLVALAASYVPAIRAARVDPMQALRHE